MLLSPCVFTCTDGVCAAFIRKLSVTQFLCVCCCPDCGADFAKDVAGQPGEAIYESD